MKIDVQKLKKIVGENNVRDNLAELYVYGSDASVHYSLPWVVVRPTKVEQIQEIVYYANKKVIPIVPRGGGSGMSGQAVPARGGIVLDMKKMNKILEINLPDTYIRVQAGVVDDDLNKALKPYGVFYPPGPASSRVATIGGEIANNASGVRSVKYGAVRDYLLGLHAVMADGELVFLGSTTRVEASGYQLERLLIGSEGTLAIIIDAYLKFVPIPKFRCLGMSCFNKLEEAGDTISEIMASGAEVSLVELVDSVAIRAVNASMGLGLPDVEAILFFESDGMVKELVDEEINKIIEICKKHNGFKIETSYDPKKRTEIYAGRKKLFPSLSKFRDYLACTSLADDMAVPYSKMAETAKMLHKIAERNNVVMTAYGHCGAGVMHTKVLMDVSTRKQWEDAKRAVAEVYDFVLKIGGTTSAEHGIGLSKAFAFKKEKGNAIKYMRAVKKALDPNNILNPGKLMDAPDDWVTATPLRYRITN